MNLIQKGWFKWQLRQGLKHCPEAVHAWLVALPDLHTPLSEAFLLALDFETTGLNPKQHQIISMGWVPVSQGAVQVGKGEHHLIQLSEAEQLLTEESIKIHGLTHQALAAGESLDEVLNALWRALRGDGEWSRVPLVHFARIEKGFLTQVCRQQYGCVPPLPMVDTFDLALRQMPPQTAVDAGKLRLNTLRRQYHLPEAPPHHALEDAIATAELFLAQIKHRPDAGRLLLEDVLV